MYRSRVNINKSNPGAGAAHLLVTGRLITAVTANCKLHLLSLVKAAVIHRQPAAAILGIHLDETFAETHVAPAVILLRLNCGGNDWVDSNHRDNQEDPAGFERFGSCTKERTRFIDGVPQS